jgi:hypothetical protein
MRRQSLRYQTFSNESQWAPPNAPAWNEQDQLVSQGGRIVVDERAKQDEIVKLLMGAR